MRAGGAGAAATGINQIGRTVTPRRVLARGNLLKYPYSPQRVAPANTATVFVQRFKSPARGKDLLGALMSPRKPQSRYKTPHDRDADACCLNCGRQAPECKCGEPTSLTCSIHDEPMHVTAIPVYKGIDPNDPRVRAIVAWINVAECPRLGCTRVRSLKYGQGVNRNCNRKGGR